MEESFEDALLPLVSKCTLKAPAQKRHHHATAQISFCDSKYPKYIKDVVMMHALPFLPAKSLSRCKAVSKDWYSWISNPFFAHKQSTQFKNFSGLFCQLPGECPSFISLESDAYGIPTPPLGFLPENVNIRTSCNGLLCCRSRLQNDVYYICNPVTKQWKGLPKPNLYHGPEVAVALAFEPGVLNFKATYELICVVTFPDHPVVYFEIYSSRTSTWRVADTTCCELDGLELNGDGFYHKGTVYWETFAGAVLAFNLKNEEYGILPLPLCAGPNGVLTQMNGELCYVLPRVQAGACTIEVYGNMNMSLKCEIALNAGCYIGEKCRVLTCVDDDTLIVILGMDVYAYRVREEKMIMLGSALSDGYAKYLPYINSLVPVGHPLVPAAYKDCA